MSEFTSQLLLKTGQKQPSGIQDSSVQIRTETQTDIHQMERTPGSYGMDSLLALGSICSRKGGTSNPCTAILEAGCI